MEKAKVLIARGQSKTTLQIKNRLSRLGYQVAGTVSTISSIFKNIDQKKPDLILLDLRIGDGDDGIKIANEICSSFAVSVVLLDGQASHHSASTADPILSLDCVSPPYRREELHAAI